jgi:hypothetical protein
VSGGKKSSDWKHRYICCLQDLGSVDRLAAVFGGPAVVDGVEGRHVWSDLVAMHALVVGGQPTRMITTASVAFLEMKVSNEKYGRFHFRSLRNQL